MTINLGQQRQNLLTGRLKTGENILGGGKKKTLFDVERTRGRGHTFHSQR